MKTFFLLAVRIVLVSISFSPMTIAAPPMPNDVKMVEPAPSIPKDLAAFFGKWEGADAPEHFFLIVERINEERASLYTFRRNFGWSRYEAIVVKEGEKHKLRFRGRAGLVELILSGEYLDLYLVPVAIVRHRRAL